MNQVQFVITGSFAALEPRVYPGVSIRLDEGSNGGIKAMLVTVDDYQVRLQDK